MNSAEILEAIKETGLLDAIASMSPDRSAQHEFNSLQRDFNMELIGQSLAILVSTENQERALDDIITIAKASFFDTATDNALSAPEVLENLDKLLTNYSTLAESAGDGGVNLTEATGLSEERLEVLQTTNINQLTGAGTSGSSLSLSIEINL